MKIYIIRHAKVDMKWPKWCSSIAFDRACETYDKSYIDNSTVQAKNIDIQQIYVSQLSRSQETAKCLFPYQNYIIEGLLNEVPLKSSIDCFRNLPLWFWNITGRLQWFFNHDRQPETRRYTRERADKFSELLIENSMDALVVTHGFYMKMLINRLRKHGFKIGHNSFRYSNCEVIEVVK